MLRPTFIRGGPKRRRRAAYANVQARLARFPKSTQGVAAVEFALILPAMMLVVAGMIVFGIVFSMQISVQQLSAEAARASVAGLTFAERDALARTFVRNNASGYPLLDSDRLTLATDASADGSSFTLRVRYDISGTLVSTLGGKFFNLDVLEGKAAVQRGGY